MHAIAPADELARIRAEIARLRDREQELRKRLLAAPEAARDGDWTRIKVSERVIRLFDHRLLPDAVRNDPRYWRERVVTELRCVPMPLRSPTPWVPPARPAQAGGRLS
ncbi:MAG: hypothetical protein Kow0013_00880 [Pararhodobacter sp.]